MKKNMKKQNRFMKLLEMNIGIKQQRHIPKQQLQITETELRILYGPIHLIAKVLKPTSEKHSSS